MAIIGILGELRNRVDGSLFADNLAIDIAIRNEWVATRTIQGLTSKLDAKQ